MENWKKAWSKWLRSYFYFFGLSAIASYLLLLLYLSLSQYSSVGIFANSKLIWKLSFSFLGVIFFSLPFIFHKIYNRFISEGRRAQYMTRKAGFFTIIPVVLLIGMTDLSNRATPEEAPAFSWIYNFYGMSDFGHEMIAENPKLRGVHYFSRFRSGNLDFSRLVENNVEYLVLVPYAYQESYDDPDLHSNRRRRRSNFDRDSLYMSVADQADACGLKVLIKPHIWMRTDQGKWRSDIDFDDQADFDTWGRNYADFILHYARLSETMKSSHFCIGTELSALTKNHPEYWRKLIAEVRKVYSGKIFYAANWYQEYEHILFWDQLDYVGIQAYFPLCKKDHPTVDELVQGWKPHVNKLKKFSAKVKKPILFSELGYKSTHDAAVDPWEWVTKENESDKKLSAGTQANCYEAFFQSFWGQPWFAGTLIWQWQAHYDEDERSTATSIDFTPQHKPAQDVMAKWFGRQSVD